MYKIFIFNILLFITLPYSVKCINFVHWSFSESVSQAKYRDKPIFLFVYSDKCMESRRMEDIFKNKKVSKLYDKKFLCVKYKLEESLSRKLKAEFWGVTSYPTFIFFTKEGNIIFKESGYHNYYKFIEMANKALDY